MHIYVIKRLIAFIPTIILVSLIGFTILRIVPGDPAISRLLGPTGDAVYTEADLEIQREKMGTNRRLYMQYFSWARGLTPGRYG